MRRPQVPASPVSLPVHVGRLPRAGMPVRIDASEMQRDALATAHGIASVSRFTADLVVLPWKRGGVRVDGSVEADIVQQCVVTLEPIANHIGERIGVMFFPEDSKLGRLGFAGAGEIFLPAEGPDSPETFTGDTIDVGALAEEFFALAIDPYPRMPGAELAKDVDKDEETRSVPPVGKAKR